MYYLLIVIWVWGFLGCGGESDKGAPTDAGDNAQISAAFADTSLEGAVRQALRRLAGALRDEDLAGLSELEARGRGIVSLQGIGQLANLVRLDLADNGIADISPLASLGKLQYLDLDNNRVRDLSALAGLSQLEVVVLGHNLVQDIAPLLGLSHLKSAELSGNPLSGGVENAQLAALQEKGVEVSFQTGVTPPPDEINALNPVFRLAYVSKPTSDRRGDIFLATTDGSLPVNLTNKQEIYSTPAWSPDGTKIAFISDDDPFDAGSNIFVMNADGSNRLKLTDRPGNYALAWSPEGTKLAFSKGINSDVFVMDIDGSNVVQLTDDPAWDSGPCWSPDGTRIAFVRSRGAYGTPERQADILLMNADGTNPIALTDHPTSVGSPVWSPDGTRIAFAISLHSPDPDEIFTVDVESKILIRLTENPAIEQTPSWSPDGSRIAFISNRDGKWDIFTVSADGSGEINLTNDPPPDFSPQWSSDGSKIAFLHIDGSRFDVFIINADGGQPMNLTNQNPGASDSGGFAWAPR